MFWQNVLLHNCFSYLWLCQILELISLPEVSGENRLFLRSEVTVLNVTQVPDKLIATFFV